MALFESLIIDQQHFFEDSLDPLILTDLFSKRLIHLSELLSKLICATLLGLGLLSEFLLMRKFCDGFAIGLANSPSIQLGLLSKV